MNGKLYSVWTDGEMSPVFNVYEDDTEALVAFRNLISAIRKDISAGVIDQCTDGRLHLYCHGFIRDGVIYGIKEPVALSHGDEVQLEVTELNTESVPPVEDFEVSF